ncbi:uncharacterized protein LOC121249372 [Juglans microcarpa x Juglans regia]|uniref:uncharacterized protein LOC121249372 n=1 Tax=Juglans microcarpa x Juglans regia TaxID=2249226 RepID=UPI001B7DC303|nr:uncharacterized protein LOC121249372 [Juglans microcarpa x Juglans regia]
MEQVNALILSETLQKFGDPDSPKVQRSRLSQYFHYDLWDWVTSIMLQLANRSVKVPRGIVEDILVQKNEAQLIKVLRKYQGAIGWTIADIKGIDAAICTHRIHLEDDARPVHDAQRKLNPTLKEVVKEEVLKLLAVGITPSQTISGRFIQGFSSIAKSLCTFLQNDIEFVWTDECQKAFDTLKESLTTAPIMQPSQWDIPFEIMTDASDYALGAVLGQHVDNRPFVIYYASRTLNDAQKNYTTTEKELLALVFAHNKFRAYILGSPVTILTDHSTLKYLLIKKDAKSRLIRWILLL